MSCAVLQGVAGDRSDDLAEGYGRLLPQALEDAVALPFAAGMQLPPVFTVGLVSRGLEVTSISR